MFSSSTWTNLANFHHTSHGKVLGMLITLLFLSASALSAMYQEIFSPRLDTYFLMLCISFGLISLLAIIFVRKVPEVTSYEPIEFIGIKEDTSQNIFPFLANS